MKNEKIYLDDFISGMPTLLKNPYHSQAKASFVIKENSEQNIRFNVMPEKHVSEKVDIKEYRLWDNAIEAVFDRKYETDMLSSPSHLTFLSSLINLQKMVYLFMHYYLSLPYNKDGKELLKVWPGKLEISMPKMILKKKNISHLMIIKSIDKLKENRYRVSADTIIDNSVSISGEALIVVL